MYRNPARMHFMTYQVDNVVSGGMYVGKLFGRYT